MSSFCTDFPHLEFCHQALRRSQTWASTLPHFIEICKSECKYALRICDHPSLSVQIENIDACLSFLAAKGVNIQGLSAEGKPGFYILLFLEQEGRSEERASQKSQAMKQLSIVLWGKDKEWQLILKHC